VPSALNVRRLDIGAPDKQWVGYTNVRAMRDLIYGHGSTDVGGSVFLRQDYQSEVLGYVLPKDGYTRLTINIMVDCHVGLP